MKPFQDYELSKVIANQLAEVNKKIDSMSNEEIMANDLEILAENIFQEFFIQPVTIFEEDFSKRSIKQGKIQKYVDPFFRDVYGRKYVEVDGVIAEFYFPYIGEPELFKCRASTFSIGIYPEITVNKKNISFRIDRALSEMDNPSAKNNLLGSLEKELKEIRDGISYANNDVNSFNRSLKTHALQ